MALSDKVLQAQAAARQVKSVEKLAFSTEVQNGFFIVLQGVRIAEVDSLPDANQWADDLNASVASTKSSLIVALSQRVDDIINA